MADRIVAFAGSLRRGSYNRALIQAAQELAPDGMTIEPVETVELPFYNADVEAEGDPPAVAAFKAALRQAHGILIATPEYNDGIPAVLTNAIDWGSRLPGRSPLMGKPIAVMGASPSQIGTARAQLHLRQLLAHVQARVLPPPELLVARAHERFDAGLRLKDEGTRRVLADLLVRFSRWIRREQAAAEAERELATKAPSK
ncbi:MAG TPA: NAD(P)H-dependent oxidoreductase [Gemmatimonadales bacterium]|nr:NAD(P)H-dependent oxidoreductase [Gemmatimonadales bacterium]